MKAGFYEFEFTVAFIHDFLKKSEARGSQAMVGLPTPAEEAQVGYDATLATNGYPRFFQFKRPDYIGAGRGNQGQRYPHQPYYRINITPHESSHQHNLLVNLAKRGYEVYYVAPIFHDPQQLDQHRSTEEIMEQSIWVPTQDLRLQKRGDRSCITYLPDGTWKTESSDTTPRRSEPSYEYPVRSARTRPMNREYFDVLRRDLEEIFTQEDGQEPDYRQMDLRSREVEDIAVRDETLGFRVTAEPGEYRRVTESDRARFLVHSRFRLKAITVSDPSVVAVGQPRQV